MTMQIEQLLSEDADRLRDIRLRSLLDAPDAFGSLYDEVAARPDESWRQQIVDVATFVAVLDGNDVGIVRCDPDHEVRGTAWLISMWVAPSARGRGVGDELVTTLLDWASENGFQKVLLDVGDANTHAISLYDRMGFKPNGVTSRIPPPRSHITEHQRERAVSVEAR